MENEISAVSARLLFLKREIAAIIDAVKMLQCIKSFNLLDSYELDEGVFAHFPGCNR